MLVHQLNNQKYRKPVVKAELLPQKTWFSINYIAVEKWNDEKKNSIFAIKLDTDKFNFYVTARQACIFMRQVFGRYMDGNYIEDPTSVIDDGFNVRENICALDDNLQFRLEYVPFEDKDGGYYAIEFRTLPYEANNTETMAV